MKLSLVLILFTTLFVAGCGAHFHGYYDSPPSYYHDHRLRCGHYVSCRFDEGAHHYRPHYGHRVYYHRHVVRGYYVPCHVAHGRHYY